MSPELQRIAERLASLHGEIESHEAAIAKLRVEVIDFETAQRVLRSLSDKTEPTIVPVASPTSRKRGKPFGTPTMPDMIIEALELAVKSGAPGLTPSGLLSFVQGKYWPEAKNSDCGPTAWRMERAGQLRKEGALYCLPSGKDDSEHSAVREGDKNLLHG